jgi:hypothetical protein
MLLVDVIIHKRDFARMITSSLSANLFPITAIQSFRQEDYNSEHNSI